MTQLAPFSKRFTDLVLSVLGLLVLSPIFLVVALAIKLDTPGPVFFRQERVGRGGVPFNILKFRTMSVMAANAVALTIGADNRITRVGRFLRKYKIDELPQLLNVALGEMSLVGPRPEALQYFVLYPCDAQSAMTSMRPGITGPYFEKLFNESELLSVSENPIQSYKSYFIPLKGEYAVSYASNRTFCGDLAIIGGTVWKVLHSLGHVATAKLWQFKRYFRSLVLSGQTKA